VSRAIRSSLVGLALLAVGIFACSSAPAMASGILLGRLGPDRPAEPGFRGAREAFACAFLDTFTTAALDTVDGDTTDGPSLLTTYACRPWTESGPEDIYRLEVTSRVEFSARLTGLAGGVDLDLILLGACDTDACLAQENTGFTAILDPGNYVLIVEGYQGSAGAYRLLMSAQVPGVPADVCAEGGAIAVTTPQSGGTETGNLFGLPDRIHAYPGCSDLWHLAGEAWYAVTLPAAGETEHQRVTVTANAVDPTLDLALWVFDGCGEAAQCLDFADDGIGGAAESLVLENLDQAPRVVLLAVDAFRPPATTFAGGFNLQFTGAVPTERRSLGSVRALFR
jgi:hypothetical protein